MSCRSTIVCANRWPIMITRRPTGSARRYCGSSNIILWTSASGLSMSSAGISAITEAGMAPPLISVLIPTFNRAVLLEAALTSLAGQSLGRDRFEVIVVDDGSTDDTRAVCQALGARLRLRYIR